MSHYIHNLPGRLRVQSAQLRHASCKATELCLLLDSLEGVKNYKFNEVAGSFLVQYDDTKLSSEDILYQMYKTGCLKGNWSNASSTQKRSVVTQLGTSFGTAIFASFAKKGLETTISSITKAFI